MQFATFFKKRFGGNTYTWAEFYNNIVWNVPEILF